MSYTFIKPKKKKKIITHLQEFIDEINIKYPVLWAGIGFFQLQSIMSGWCLNNHKISYQTASLWVHSTLLGCAVMFILSLESFSLSDRVGASMIAVLLCLFLYYPFL